MEIVGAIDVSRLFLSWSRSNGDIVTNLKLQKLLYYAQAWHMVNFNQRLFSEGIEAWVFGPVVPSIYRKYKRHEGMPIPYKIKGDEHEPFTGKQLRFLESLFETYNSFSATALVNMTHNEDPWKDAYAKGQNTEIAVSAMNKYYRQVYENARRT